MNLAKTLQDGNTYYIHLNQAHIGANHSKDQNFYATYNVQRANVRAALKKQYVQLLNSSLSNTDLQTLEAVLNLKEDELLDAINEETKKKLQEVVNDSALQVLHQTVNNYDLSGHLRKAIISQNKTNLNQLQQVFEIIAEVLKLFDGGPAIGAALLTVVQGGTSRAKIGGKLLAATSTTGILTTLLNQYAQQENYNVISYQSLKSAISLLNNIGYALKHGQFKSGGKNKTALTSKGFASLILNNLVSTSMAEGLAICSSQKAKQVFGEEVIRSLTGKEGVVVQQDYNQYKKITGKADMKLKNTYISLDVQDQGRYSANIQMNIGISSKFYAGQKFNSSPSSLGGIYSSGSGGSLAQAIRTSWGYANDIYLVYNKITHQQDTEEINSILATRQLIRLFSSADLKHDFANFMVLNGQIISIWDMIQYTLNSDLFYSRSMMENDTSSNQGIVLTIIGRKDIIGTNTKVETNDRLRTPALAAWQRSRNVNAKFEAARIKAEIHLKNLAKAINI